MTFDMTLTVMAAVLLKLNGPEHMLGLSRVYI